MTEAQKTAASYSYNVSKNRNIGDQAEINFTIHSDNYDDITFKVHITLTDRISVIPKEGAEPAVEGSNELHYGQTISDLKLNTSKAKFVTPDGTEVSGTLKFNTLDDMPEVGTKTTEYIFTPEDEQYKSYTGSIAINVIKQTLKLEGVGLDGSIYDSQKTLKDIAIDTGVASVTIKGKYQPIYGIWKIVNEDQPVPLGKYKATVQFTPNDTVHYTTQTAEADGGRTRIVLDVDKTNAMTGNTAEDSWEGIKITKKEEEKPPVKDPEPTTSNSKPTTSNSKPTTAQKPSTYTGVKVNQTATINGITYKVTKVVNAKNAQVTIKSLNKKK